MKTKILMLAKDNEERETRFEIEYLLSLSKKQRFRKFFSLCDFVKRLAEKHGYRKTNRKTAKAIQQE